MKYLASLLSASGKLADCATSWFGILIGFRESNMNAMRVDLLIIAIIVYPLILAILEWRVLDKIPQRLKLILLIPGIIAWLPVLWNIVFIMVNATV